MKSIYRLLRYLVYFLFGLSVIGAGGLFGTYLYLEPKLPSIDTLKDVRLQVPLRIYSNDHLLIAEFGEKRREPLDFDEIPPVMIEAFLAAEDDRFFQHPGVDYQGILRAASQLLLTGERRQGGSTITMQVARNFFLSSKKTYTRKLNEILLALKIERMLSKEEILELYLNKIYLGHRSYGVGAAALVYYGRPVEKLELSEIAMIAGLPKAPSRYNPISDPQRALIRRNYVLGRMLNLDYISQLEYDTAKASPITAELHTTPSEVEAPYVAEMARAEAVARFGQDAYTSGYTITTTIVSHLQTAANSALRQAIQAYDKRHGYRGVAGHHDITDITEQSSLFSILAELPNITSMEKAIVTAVHEQTAEALTAQGEQITLEWPALSWARAYVDHDHKKADLKQTSEVLLVGDIIYLYQEIPEKGETYWRLAQVPEVSGALVSLSPQNGAIKALVGGYDFYLSKFNRVTQAKRQPGSGFKAFIYSAALEAGFTPASMINDAPVVFDDVGLEAAWRPENYSGKFFGPTRLRYALTHSRNLVSIRLLRKMGIKHAIDYASRFGFDKNDLPRDLSLALGSGAVTPLAMSKGYSVLANGGYYVSPHVIDTIRSDKDEILYQANPTQVCNKEMTKLAKESADGNSTLQNDTEYDGTEPKIPHCAKRAITKQNNYLMNSMLRDVIQHGTARKARALGRRDIAGKTGTTNDQRDAWFNGFNHYLVTTTWIGFDDVKPLGRGEVGGRAALPAWIDYMRIALNGIEEILPEMPADMVTMRIDVDTGEPVGVGSPNSIFEVFEVQNAPKLPNGHNSNRGGKTNTTTTVTPIEDPF
ncbi:MAG: penicillin-binding protein 1A [Candidatus Thiodiazotropha sp. (ex Lucinoma borealis)]|nr:penicillin-binding protein 1A [Candidatus Thiodiazotropha sp. (ex Lucinoma borealis)]